MTRDETEQHDGGRRFITPPALHRSDGAMRRVGFELEFSGLDLDTASGVLRQVLGGNLERSTAARHRVDVPGSGTFEIEIDWHFLQRMAREQAAATDGAADWIDPLSRAATLLVPIEVVCPPLPIDRLGQLHALADALREAGAVGTEESLIAAYGVHINPELPSLDAPTLHGYLRAFALLQWWLFDANPVDTARRVSPYIDPWPEAYLRTLLESRQPELERICDDYLEHNASRNRALDLLPLLAQLDRERVARAVDDPRIKARPTLHYRLPDCHIEREDWSLAQPWNTWVLVERLAADNAAQESLAAEFLAAGRPLLGVGRSAWTGRMEQWLRGRGWV